MKQRGFTLITLLFLLALAAIVAWVGMKIVPPYMDFFTVENILNNIIKEDGVELSDEQIRNTFEKRLDTNYINFLTRRDLVISRERGKLTLTVPVNRKTHMAYGVYLSVELEAKAQGDLSL